MKKIFYFICFYLFLFVNKTYSSLESTLIDKTDSNLIANDIKSVDWLSVLWNLFSWAKDELMSLAMIASIGAFLYIGIKLATARWNPEEFKKAWLHFVYAVIGVFIIFMAWWAVKLVSTLSL